MSMIWPFRSKAKPAVRDRRDMNEDWKAGDLAECTHDKWLTGRTDNPRLGDILRVTQIADTVGSRGRAYFLRFAGKSPARSWECIAFRKIRPLHEPCEADFTALVKRRRKVGA